MESTGKIILWIVVALLVVGGLYYWFTKGSTAPAPATQTPATQQQAQAPQSQLPSGADTSDAGLSQDLTGMDTQISSMNADTASIDSGMNDQPIAQQ